MCMITYLPGGVSVKDHEWGIENGAWINNDGHGWAIAADIDVMLVGRFMDYELAIATFRQTREAYPDAPALFHSRWATHGLTGPVNVHPFPLGKHAVVAHNGVLPSAFHPLKGDTRSDTAIMAQEWLPWESKSGLWTRKERRRVGMAIGTHNKLVILSVSPKLEKPKGFIVNQASGEWVDGAWYSNDGYRGWSGTRYAGYAGKKTSTVWEHDGKSFSTFDDYWRAKYGEEWATNAKDQEKSSKPVDPKDVPNLVDNECPYCHALDGMDWAGSMCTICDTCLDCGQSLSDALDPCLCYTPRWLEKRVELNCGNCGDSESDCTCSLFVPEGFMQ